MRIWRVFAILASVAGLLPAQVAAPKPGPSIGTAGTLGTGTAGTATPSNTSSTPDLNGTSASISGRGAFYFGKVAMGDGSTPPVGIVIQRVCGSVVRPMAYTDTRGEFSFQIGETQDMLTDASSSESLRLSGRAGSANGSGLGSACELRATLAGYRSDVINLAGRRTSDSPNVGTIFLHPYAKTEGLTVSATSELAPKEARKDFEKGLAAVKKSKLDEAQDDFLKATDLYPRYAAAWLELGRIYQQHNQMIEAREAYRRSIAADPKFVEPYERTYLLSFNELKWEDVAAVTDRVIHLNPYEYPDAYFYNAVANSELQRLDPAEKSAREAIAAGGAHPNPKAQYILGVVLAKKKDFKGAAECLRAYLSTDAVTDRKSVTLLLANIEKQPQDQGKH